MRRILIISESSDIHANDVEKSLISAGEKIVRLNTNLFFLEKVELTFGDKRNGITVSDIFTHLSEIKSVLYRKPGNIPVIIDDIGQKEFAEKEIQELLEQLYFCLPNSFWVNNYSSLKRARHKYLQLDLAKSMGMKIPKTLITNSPTTVKDFYKLCHERMVYKTMFSPVIKMNEGFELWRVPTTLIDRSLLDQIDLISMTGGIFQEYIEKKFEIRTTIIGNNVFSAKINSQQEQSAMIDWREAVASNKVLVEKFTLPKHINDSCLSFVKSLNLNFGALDLIVTPKNEYYFLEINPNGQWLWVEDFTRQPLLATMTKLLADAHL